MTTIILCSTCQAAVAGESEIHENSYNFFAERIIYRHHRTYDSLLEAKESGCALCNVIWFQFFGTNKLNVTDVANGCDFNYSFYSTEVTGCLLWVFVLHIIGATSKAFNSIRFEMLQEESSIYEKSYKARQVQTVGSECCPKLLEQSSHEIAPCTDSPSCVNLAHTWLSECQKEHPKCRAYSGLHPILPKRVIDVGSPGEPLVRIHVGSFQEHGHYVTLSHCWGDANFLKLTLANENALRDSFSISLLPKTFREAIQFTRAVSVRYLWIDSLCIVQDSLEDWAEQSALMGQIYKNCLFNIAATKSPNSEGGLYFSRDPKLIRPLKLAVKWREAPGQSKYQGVYYVWLSDIWWDHIEGSPLNKRGWVLQERLLAPRTLHFSDQIFWDCKTKSCCEIIPSGEPSTRGWQDFYREFSAVLEKLLTSDSIFNERHNELGQKAYFGWWFAIDKYSKCQLTHDNDILVAISGIAKVMARAVKDEYLAGHWRRTLLLDLLWRPWNISKHLICASPRAPTWSWASIKGAIRTRRFNSHANETHFYIAEIVNTNVELVGDDETGQVEMGCISLRARTLDVKWRFENSDKHISFDIEGETFNGLASIDEEGAWCEAKQSKTNGLVFVPTLFMAGWKDEKELRCEGLVLRMANEEFHYVRYGTFDSFHKHHTTVNFRRFQERYISLEKQTIIIF